MPVNQFLKHTQWEQEELSAVLSAQGGWLCTGALLVQETPLML